MRLAFCSLIRLSALVSPLSAHWLRKLDGQRRQWAVRLNLHVGSKKDAVLEAGVG